MRSVTVAVKKFAIFCHRWMGVTFCVLFLWWFVSGIFMMYWDYPAVSEKDRLQRSPALDASQVKVSPSEAYATLQNEQQPGSARLASFDGRPAYHFRVGRGSSIVYADTGQLQEDFSPELNLRSAAAWTGQAATSAKVESMDAPDQWTLEGRLRTLRPMNKYSFPDGQQVYIAEETGEIVQYTTTSSRIFAYLGAIPHWLYFTPLRVNGKVWSQVVIWTSGLATIAALLGLVVGLWMYSPSKKYRHQGAATSIPYTGQKRLHTQLGLFFGILACTWAFSGMLSMDPFPLSEGPAAGQAKGQGKGKAITPSGRIQAALTGGRFQLTQFEAKHPAEALKQLDAAFGAAGNSAQEAFHAKQLEFSSFAGEPVFLASNGSGQTKIVPVDGAPASDFGEERVINLVRQSAQAANISELKLLTQYDRYYLDRAHQAPLPVVYVKLKDESESRLYIDPKTGRTVARYNNSTAAWVERWLYHGLHSLNFPWLYNYRPAWDIVVLTLMGLCTWLCVTSLILAWRVVRGKFRRSTAVGGTALRETQAQ